MSERDVQTIRDVFQRTVKNMTDGGVRTDPGWLNNASTFLNMVSAGTLGHDYSACRDQADFMTAVLGGLSLDDPWVFEPVRNRIYSHAGVFGRPSNPNDPLLLIDPWNDQIDEKRRPEGTDPNPADSPTAGSHDNGLPHDLSAPGTPVMCTVCLRIHGPHNFLGGTTCWCGAKNDYIGQPR